MNSWHTPEPIHDLEKTEVEVVNTPLSRGVSKRLEDTKWYEVHSLTRCLYSSSSGTEAQTENFRSLVQE